MARLIIGHTTENSVKIWVRGDSRFPCAFVTVDDGSTISDEVVELEARHFFTGIAEIKGLSDATQYDVNVTFGEDRNTKLHHRVTFGHCDGQFWTFPKSTSTSPFSFILGSCNLHSLGVIANPDKAFQRITDVAMDKDISFMIHCGDQIYYDIPNPIKPPNEDEYREKYLDAWGDSRRTRRFLTQFPQYMILDDHEITNDFANDMMVRLNVASPEEYKDTALKIYREFQHIRHPHEFGNQALFYKFAHADVQFFVMDTRSERYLGRQGDEPRMIRKSQMDALRNWLTRHKTAVKFIVTSVPFVFEVIKGKDKWCGESFLAQREEIIEHIVDDGIQGVTFLTGDMHCSGHATMNVTKGTSQSTIHEIMSSPINQIGKSNIDDFHRTRTRTSINKRFTYKSSFLKSEFYDDSSNATVVEVSGRNVTFEVFRTKKDKVVIPAKTYAV